MNSRHDTYYIMPLLAQSKPTLLILAGYTYFPSIFLGMPFFVTSLLHNTYSPLTLRFSFQKPHKTLIHTVKFTIFVLQVFQPWNYVNFSSKISGYGYGQACQVL